MVACWQTLGFVHGVLNTDNMSILGLTIDYGPFGFLDAFDPNFSPNITDIQSGSRYAFKNQPQIGQWNLIRLGEALARGDMLTTDEIETAVQRYQEVLTQEYTERMARKMGLRTYDRDLVVTFLQNLFRSKGDFTNGFRSLSSISISDEDGIPKALGDAFGEEINEELKQEWLEWIRRYREVLRKENIPEMDRIRIQNSANPKVIPRQHILQRTIEAAELGSFQELETLMELLRRPFDETSGVHEFTQPPPKELIRPGVCFLSCSS